MRHLELLAQLEAHPESRVGSSRIVPTSFDATDPDLRGFVADEGFAWPSCAFALKNFHSHGVMMRLPLFWQLEIPLFKACREAGALIFVNDPDNMQLGEAALDEAEIDTVVTDAKDTAAFTSYLLGRTHALPKSWIIVHRSDAPSLDLPEVFRADTPIAQEVHLFPGVPLLTQCPTLYAKHASSFHLSEDFSVEMREDESLVTTMNDALFPLISYSVARRMQSAGTCICGKETLAVL